MKGWVTWRSGDDEGIAWMAKQTGSAAARLSALIAEIEAGAYARGRADARKEVLSALGAVGQSALKSGSQQEKPPSTRAARKRRTSGGKRAPRGSVRALVERALQDQPGQSAQEILARAGTDAERLVRLGSIRVELQTGRRLGRYESKDGRWSLVASPSAEGDGASDTRRPPEPDEAAGGPDGDAPGEDAASGKPGTGGGPSRLGMNW